MTGGHGHVTPRPDGLTARCGGPSLCEVCARELAALAGVQIGVPAPAVPERWLSINDAAKVVGVSRRTVYYWMRDGLLVTRRTVGGTVRILESSLWEQPNSPTTNR